MNQPPRIGIIGIGAMGFAMATNLRRRGHTLHVRDIDPAAVAAAATQGIPACDSAAALAAHSDLIAIVVVDAKQADEVLFGTEGVIHAAARDEPLAVMICSTIAASDTERFRDRLAAQGVALLDAPISGGPVRAAAGTMSMMLACDRALFDRFEPVLREMAGTLFFVGERVGDAARTKLSTTCSPASTSSPAPRRSRSG